MSLPHALLGMINQRPATGYTLKAGFKESIHYFWNATLPQIYRTLNQLESDGWLTSSMEHQTGKPSRKVYEITEAGRAELLRWLAEPPEVTQPKQPLLMKVFFGKQLPAAVLRKHIMGFREYFARRLAVYESEVEPLIDSYARKLGAPDEARYWEITLDYGKRHAQTTIEWCDEALKKLSNSDETGGHP